MITYEIYVAHCDVPSEWDAPEGEQFLLHH